MPGIKDLKNRVVVVTGAGSGIGRAIALLFAEKGACLVIADINEIRLGSVRREIAAHGAPVLTVTADVSDMDSVQNIADAAMRKFKRVDVLVNNAGIGYRGPADLFPLEDLKRVMDVNFWGVIHGVQAFLPIFKKQGFGHIVNTSSTAGLSGIPGLSAYTASKHAVSGYSEVLRAELAWDNIGVTAVCPGVINTNVTIDGKSFLRDSTRFTQEKVVDFYRKWGWPPERVARAVVRAVKRNTSVVPVGPEAWFAWFFKRFSQTFWDACLRFAVKPLL